VIAFAESAGTADDEPPCLDDYRALERIDAGGMGVVWRVCDLRFGRSLAIKVMKSWAAIDPGLVQRFVEEAQICGQLAHPFIVPVHAMGRLPDGRPYYTMKLIEGRTLATLLEEELAPTARRMEAVQIFAQVCQATAFAHSRSVIHRDLKPANVMVGQHGEVQVMDWGLAKRLGEDEGGRLKNESDSVAGSFSSFLLPPSSFRSLPASSMDETQPGSVLGTWPYMPPEQARGLLAAVDRRSDVFGLGAMLCEILTGQPPYTGTPAQIQRDAQAAHLAAAHSRLDACGADADLVQLAVTCLQGKAEDRPRDAGAVEQAVTAYLASVQERLRQAELERAAALARAEEARARADAEVQARRAERRSRQRTRALAATVLALVVAAAGGALWYQRQQAAHAVQLARAEMEISSALDEGSELAKRTGTMTENLPSWQATLVAAQSAVKRAEALLAQEPDLATEALGQQVGHLKTRLAEEEKDWQLLAAYEQVRLEQSQWDLQRRRFKLAEAYPRLRQALVDYGLAIDSMDASEAAARLRQRPPAVQKYMQAIFEECLVWAPENDVRQRQWLTAVLAGDDDRWLQLFRQARVKGPRARLKKLATHAEVARHHPAVLVGFARNLPEELRAARLVLLRRTQHQYPGDFWANLELGNELYQHVFPRGAIRPARGEELPVMNEAAAFYRVAVGLRPGNAPAHNNLGSALRAQGDLPGSITCYQQALKTDPRLADAHSNLGLALQAQGDLAGAIACFHQALAIDSNYAVVHTNLGAALFAQKDVKAAIACYQQALALDSRYAMAHNNLGTALKAQGDLKGAIACYQKALALDPRHVPAHSNLGNALFATKDVKGAMTCLTRALELDPREAGVHYNLGQVLQSEGEVTRAIASYRKAVELEPNDVKTHIALGNLLQAQGDLTGAIACFKRALDLEPACTGAHTNLGNALYTRGDVNGASACFNKALALDPRCARAHYGLGNTRYQQGDVKGAIACYEKALALDPEDALAHTNLGVALGAQGDLTGAICCYKKAISLDPRHVNAHGALGSALLAQGAFREAREATQQALRLLPGGHSLRPVVTRQLDECQRLLNLDARLTAILAGDEQPADASEQLALAELCQHYKKRYAAATHFYEGAFAAGTARTAQRAYNAACAAALAGVAKSEDAAKLDAKEKVRLRQQALAWLGEALKHHGQQIQGADAQTRTAIQETLRHWQQDGDLASLRDEQAVAKLPEADQRSCRHLWADVAALLTRGTTQK
jgi:tetratricopeptide (TPR) repeat protein